MATKTMSKVEVYTLEGGKRYAVPSASIPGFAYEVIQHSPQPGDISCGCKGFEFRRTCKHVREVQRMVPLEDPGDADRELSQLVAELYR